MIREALSKFRDNYHLQFIAYKPITSKTYKARCDDNSQYFVKKSELYVREKYNFLHNQGIKNILYPIRNNRGEFITDYQKEKYFVMDYIRDFDVIPEVKAVSLADELSSLHLNTYFKRQLSVKFSRSKMEELYEYLLYKFDVIEAFVRTLEARPFDEYSITILKNYYILLDAKNVMAKFHKQVVSDIKDKKSVYYSFVHNNPKINHLINYEGHHYLTSIEKSKVGIPSLDMAKYYLETEDMNVDSKTIILTYLAKFEDDFYKYYFYFLVLLFYIKSLMIYDKDYITSQSFIHTTASIKNFMEQFELLQPNE